MKNYKEIKFTPGQNIESAVKKLKESGELVCGSFNGEMLYSDIDDIDSAFKKIIGKTKFELDSEKEKFRLNYKKREEEHKEEIPKLTEYWIKKGNEVLAKEYHKFWAECVPIRLDDLYKGMELGACLNIIRELNAGCSLETAKYIIEKQEHSGMSFSLVCSMVKSFCDRGLEFVNYLNH